MSATDPTREELAGKHLAELHELAAARGIANYRMLRREQLVEAILEAGRGGFNPIRALGRLFGGRVVREPDTEGGPEAGGDEPEPAVEERAAATEDEALERVSGQLEVTRRGHGFVSVRSSRGDEEVFVSASQVNRCELRDTDEISGPVRDPRPGERHRSLARVETVNGKPVSR